MVRASAGCQLRCGVADALSGLLRYYSGVDDARLHSFPTRRSSDLKPRCCRKSGPHRSSGAGLRRPPRSPTRATTMRSEEHTSELQSLRHLVCRLLLEKKKTYSHDWMVTRMVV